MNAPPVSILIVDDHPVVRFGLVHLFENQPDFRVVGEATSCEELCAKVKDLEPDVVLMDLEMHDSSGAEAVAKLRQQHHGGQVVVFTARDEEDVVLKVLSLQVQGYISKQSSQTDICEAVRAVTHGGLFLDRTVAATVSRSLARSDLHEHGHAAVTVSDRERMVLEQLAAGKRNREIAAQLGITERAVKYHVTSLLAKLGAKNRTEAVEKAAKLKLISLQ